MPNDNILGIPTKACVNGITKSDAIEIKKIPTLESETNEIKNNTIPSLDERVTALEQNSGSNSNWKTIDYVLQTSQFFASPFFDLSNRIFKKDVIMKYYKLDASTEYSLGYVYIPKGTLVSNVIFNVNYSIKSTQNNETTYRIGVKSYTGNQIYSLLELGDEDGRVHYVNMYINNNITTGVVTSGFNLSYGLYTTFPITIYYNDI